MENELTYFNSYLKTWGTLYEIHECIRKILSILSDTKQNSSLLGQYMISYILKNYQKQISLNDLGESLGMNGNYVGRMFKKEIGTGFSEYLINIRIEKAIELMKKNKYNISQISNFCGFKNLEHFSRSFKRITNKSPKQFYQNLS